MTLKKTILDLALFGGASLFSAPKSTSNLRQPEFGQFLRYSKSFYDQHQYTNNGPNVRLLEKRLSQFHNAEFCITFCSGFWALVLAISSLALKGKDEVVMPSLTYRRMADVAAWCNLKPHFCEVEPTTLAMSAATIKPCLNSNTALILGVHPIVNCCDVDGLTALAEEKNIPLLFDSVESVYESTARGKIGSFGEAEVFSLHASKLLNGFEGGYITTNSKSLADRLASIRTFGFTAMDNISISGGMNGKLNEIHAAMALASLDSIEEQIVHNRHIYYEYKRLLPSIKGWRLLEFDENYQSGFKNIVVELQDDWPLPRADTLEILNKENILARAYYSPPLHHKPMIYPHVVSAELPVTDFLSERFVNLPCGFFVSRDDITEIIELLIFISKNSASLNDRLHKKEVH